MKFKRGPLLTLALTALVVLPACSSMQPVEVRLRDAETHAALPDGHFSGEQQALVNNYMPPDIGIPWYKVYLPAGTYTDSRLNLEVAQSYKMHVEVQAEGYGQSTLVFSVQPGTDLRAGD